VHASIAHEAPSKVAEFPSIPVFLEDTKVGRFPGIDGTY
jgi:hypothetical protein